MHRGNKGVIVGGHIYYKSMVHVNGWVLIFVNSQVIGKDFGDISNDEISLLERNLETSIPLPTLIAIHHSPTPQCPSAGCQLNNEGTFTEILKKHAHVKGVISGHTHKSVETTNGNLHQFTTPATFAHVTHAQLGEVVDHEDFWASHQLNTDLHGFRVLDLFPGGEIQTQVHWVHSD